MGDEILEAMARPEKNGAPALPRRAAPKGLLPSTWLGHSVHLEYADGFGSAVEAEGTLLDCYPTGPIVNISGLKTLVSWDALRVVQLVDG